MLRYLLSLLAALSCGVSAASAENLCPNPGIEEPGNGGAPAGWRVEGGPGNTWGDDQAHAGKRSLKITSKGGPTVSWVSAPIPAKPGTRFSLTLWAKLEQVIGRSGAAMVLYTLGADGKRSGQTGHLCLGGAGDSMATADWQQYLVVSEPLAADVHAVCVNVRLYGASGTAWFDDIEVREFITDPLKHARPLRRGIALGNAAIVCGKGWRPQADRLRGLLKQASGIDVPITDDGSVRLSNEKRDLIVVGDLTTSRVAEALYLHSYTCEDRHFPGRGGYVLRPLVDPFGYGQNFLILGASDEAGIAAGITHLERLLKETAPREGVLGLPLVVQTGEGYGGLNRYPWPGSGPRREMAHVAAYLKSGDLAHMRKYRAEILKAWFIPDEKLFAEDESLHLYYVTRTQSWDLASDCEVFTDEERLRITNRLLDMLRSRQGYSYSGLGGGRMSRENHGTRAAEAFYYGWRHFHKYYREELGPELVLWRRKLQEYWQWPLGSARSYEDSLSQHALGGSLVNALNIALMEPEWGEPFFREYARRMGDRCIAICNNMGQTVMLGDTGSSDYPGSVFAMLAYKLRDGRYTFMLRERGALGVSTDEPLRGFDVGVEPIVPRDHVGLFVVPADRLYFDTALRNKAGVPFERAFDKLTIRSGFDDDDEYLLLDGVAGGSHSYDDANTIGEYSANGRRWLCEIDIFNGPTMNFHNAVTVARDGLGMEGVPQCAELLRQASGEGYAYTATRLPDYNGVAWTRHLFWLAARYTFALDEVTAEEPGDYSLVCRWRGLGAAKLSPGRYEAAQDGFAKDPNAFGGADLVAAAGANSGKALRHLGDYDAFFYRGEAPGDYCETKLQAEKAGEYDLRLTTLDFVGRAIVQVRLNGEPVGKPIDLYVDGGARKRMVELGRVQVTRPGPQVLRFEVVGKAPASGGYTLGICAAGLHAPGEGAARRPQSANRFTLLFPPEIAATLDHDTETLGKHLPPSPHHEPVLNIVEQPLSRRLGRGERVSFHNLFYAGKGEKLPFLELRRLSDACALIRSGDAVDLVGASAERAEAAVGDLRVSGSFFHLSAQRCILGEGTTLSLAGRQVARPGPADLASIQAALGQAWEQAGASAAGGTQPESAVPALRVRARVDLPAAPLATLVSGGRVFVGCRDGRVLAFAPDATMKPAGELRTGGPVHALCAADLDGDGTAEILAGSDDEHLYALGLDLGERWRVRIPFLAEEQIWSWWTLGTAKVRRIHAADLDGDGKPEILVGAGNMRLHCLDASGKERWRFRTDHGICTTITTGDPFGEGKTRVMAGNGLTSSNGNCWVLDEQGKLLHRYFNGSWCTSLPAIAIADLDRDGNPSILCGNNRGDLRCYDPKPDDGKPRWLRNLAGPVRSLAIVPRPGAAGDAVAVGSDSGYFAAFDAAGEKAWGLPLSSAILRTEVVPQGQGKPPLIAAGCKDGGVFLVDVDGRLQARHECKARLQDLRSADVDGDGAAEVVVVTSGPDRLWVLGR